MHSQIWPDRTILYLLHGKDRMSLKEEEKLMKGKRNGGLTPEKWDPLWLHQCSRLLQDKKKQLLTPTWH